MKKPVKIHVFLILFSLVLLACVLTYILPAGSYARVLSEATGQNLVVPGSYAATGPRPVSPLRVPRLLYDTLVSPKTSGLLFFIFIIGGVFEIILQSGCIAACCERAVRAFRSRRWLIIPVITSLFSVFGFTMGLTTASIVFVPVGMALAASLGFDAITGMAMVMLGTNAGFAAGVFNPFSVGIAQTIAELPLFSGSGIRWILLLLLLPATIGYILRRSGRGDPAGAKAVLWDMGDAPQSRFSYRHAVILLLLLASLGVIMYGVAAFSWGIAEIAVVFLFLGVAAAPFSGLGGNGACRAFVDGCRKIMPGILAIGIASTLRTVLTEGNILDTIAFYLIGSVQGLPSWAQLLGMFYANALIDPLITSGSAHAAVAMPVMVPMADALGISRQAAVLAFQLGDGLPNLLSPISTTLTSCLALSGISYSKWIRWFLPLVGIYMLIGTAVIIAAGIVGL